jgi:hypothetical protein
VIPVGTWLVTLTLYTCPVLSGPFGLFKKEIPVPMALRPYVCEAKDSAIMFPPGNDFDAQAALEAAPYEDKIAAYSWDGKWWKPAKIHWRVVLEK